MSYTQEQVLAEFAKLQERVRPAVLADSHLNGALISDYARANGLEPTVDNFYTAVNALVGSLQWIIKPAKLQAGERYEKPAKIENPLLLEASRTAKIKAADAAAAQEKANAASIKQARSMIYAYNPTKRNGFDARERDDRQKFWNAALDAEIANKGNMQDFVTALSAAIEARYKAREKAAERL